MKNKTFTAIALILLGAVLLAGVFWLSSHKAEAPKKVEKAESNPNFASKVAEGQLASGFSKDLILMPDAKIGSSFEIAAREGYEKSYSATFQTQKSIPASYNDYTDFFNKNSQKILVQKNEKNSASILAYKNKQFVSVVIGPHSGGSQITITVSKQK